MAEFVGSFFLSFAGISAIILTAHANTSFGQAILIIGLAHGAALALAVYAFGPVSGAHVNPAISTSLLVVGKITPKDYVFYIIFQVAGAAVAALLCRAVYPALAVAATADGATLGAMTQQGSSQYNLGAAFVLEAVMTFFLASAVASVVRGGHTMTPASGFVIGGTLFMLILVGGYWTGTGINPGRSMGPAIAFGTGIWDTMWLYWLAPLIGGALGGYANAWLRGDKLMPENPKVAPAA
jgi:aquaporin-4